MAEFAGVETMDMMEKRHENERKELAKHNRNIIKQATGKEKLIAEAQVLSAWNYIMLDNDVV